MNDKIILTKGDVAGPTGFYIFESGEYDPSDLVACCKTKESDIAEVAFQANYIATGEHV